MKRAAGLLLMAAFSAGCAHASDMGGARLAQAQPQVCRHCNCYLPAGIPDEARCTVCHCGYPAGKCYRGR